jgi:flagellar hook assembly protein FlgD
MAQFSALQNSKDLETEMQTMRASQLLGQTVEVKLDDDSITKGVVSAVDSSSGDPKIVVGDHAYALNRVIRVDQTQTTTKAYAPPQIQTATKGYAPS